MLQLCQFKCFGVFRVSVGGGDLEKGVFQLEMGNEFMKDFSVSIEAIGFQRLVQPCK